MSEVFFKDKKNVYEVIVKGIVIEAWMDLFIKGEVSDIWTIVNGDGFVAK